MLLCYGVVWYGMLCYVMVCSGLIRVCCEVTGFSLVNVFSVCVCFVCWIVLCCVCVVVCCW